MNHYASISARQEELGWINDAKDREENVIAATTRHRADFIKKWSSSMVQIEKFEHEGEPLKREWRIEVKSFIFGNTDIRCGFSTSTAQVSLEKVEHMFLTWYYHRLMSKDDEIKGNKDYASVMDKIREKRNVDSRFNLSCDFMDELIMNGRGMEITHVDDFNENGRCSYKGILNGEKIKGKGRNAKTAKASFKKHIFRHVLDGKRLQELETGHPEFVAKARAMKAELEAQRAQSFTGKLKNVYQDTRDKVSRSTLERKNRRRGGDSAGEASAGLMHASDNHASDDDSDSGTRFYAY